MQDHGLSIHAARKSLLVHMDFGRKNLEAETLVIEKRDGIADDHVGEFADGLTNDLLAFREFRTGKLAGHAHGHFGREIEDDAALDVALDGDESGDTLAAISVLVHGEVGDFRGRLQRFGEHGIGGVDEGLNEFHSHE